MHPFRQIDTRQPMRRRAFKMQHQQEFVHGYPVNCRKFARKPGPEIISSLKQAQCICCV